MTQVLAEKYQGERSMLKERTTNASQYAHEWRTIFVKMSKFSAAKWKIIIRLNGNENSTVKSIKSFNFNADTICSIST